MTHYHFFALQINVLQSPRVYEAMTWRWRGVLCAPVHSTYQHFSLLIACCCCWSCPHLEMSLYVVTVGQAGAMAGGARHRRSQDFVCGGALFYHPAKTPKNWLLLWLGGVHLVSCGGALTHFSCKLGLKKIFSPPWGGAGAPTAPPGYAYGARVRGSTNRAQRFIFMYSWHNFVSTCDCRTCMEQSSYQHHSINLFAIFQETT